MIEIIEGYYNGHILINYCTPLDINYDELWKKYEQQKIEKKSI